jgi:hypothetical protein
MPPSYQDTLQGELHPQVPHGFCEGAARAVMSLEVEAEATHVGSEAPWWVVLSCCALGGALDSQDSLDLRPVWVA